MHSDAHTALARLKEKLASGAPAIWLDAARVKRREGRTILEVAGPFQKSWFESRLQAELEEAFGGPVEVVAGAAAPAHRAAARAMPQLLGPAGEFARRMVRAFATGSPAAGRLLLIHGAPRSGKSLLAEWACRLAGDRVFLLDLPRLRSGRSRGLVPRKPFVVADGLEQLAGRRVAQQTLCSLIDAVQDRGDRLLFTLEGHPGRREDLLPALRSRLLGGVLVPVQAEDAGQRLARGAPAEPADAPAHLLDEMKDVAARLFGVERTLLDGPTKRRSVVEARRAVITAACRAGLAPAAVARAFGLKSLKAVGEACRWADRQQERDHAFASVLHEVARVRPRT